MPTQCTGPSGISIDVLTTGLGQIIPVSGVPHVLGLFFKENSSDTNFNTFLNCLELCKCTANCNTTVNSTIYYPISKINSPQIIPTVSNSEIVINQFSSGNSLCTGSYTVSAFAIVQDDEGKFYNNYVLIEWLDFNTMTLLGTGSIFSETGITSNKTLIVRFSCPNSNIPIKILTVNIYANDCT